MSKNNHLHHLGLYIVAVSFVVVLFTFATSYGEANLKTASKIEGIYKIESSIPNCGENLQLVVQQSGIYVNAAIAPLEEISDRKSKSVSELSGKWQNQKLTLSGNSNVCKTPTAIDGRLEGEQIMGQIVSSNNTSDFRATKIDIPEAKEEKSKPH